MFDGNYRPNRRIVTSKEVTANKSSFLEATRKQREERTLEKKKQQAAKTLFHYINSIHQLWKLSNTARIELAKKLEDISKLQAFFQLKHMKYIVPAETILELLHSFCLIRLDARNNHHLQVLVLLLPLVTDSIQLHTSVQYNIIHFSLNKGLANATRKALKYFFINILESSLTRSTEELVLTSVTNLFRALEVMGMKPTEANTIGTGIFAFISGLCIELGYSLSRYLTHCLETSLPVSTPDALDTLHASILSILCHLLRKAPPVDTLIILLCHPLSLHCSPLLNVLIASLWENPLLYKQTILSLNALPSPINYSLKRIAFYYRLTRRDLPLNHPPQAQLATALGNLCQLLLQLRVNLPFSDFITYTRAFLFSDSAFSAVLSRRIATFPLFSLHLDTASRDIPELLEMMLATGEDTDMIEANYYGAMGVQRISISLSNLAIKALGQEMMQANWSSQLHSAQGILDLVTDKSMMLETLADLSDPQSCQIYAHVLMIQQCYADNPVALANRFPSLYAHAHGALSSTLNTLAFHHPEAPLPMRIWQFLQQQQNLETQISTAINTLCIPSTSQLRLCPLTSLIYLFTVSFYHQLNGVDDEELLEADVTHLAPALPAIVRMLKHCLHALYWSDFAWNPDVDVFPFSQHFSLLALQLALTRLFNRLHIRNERRWFISADEWLWPTMSNIPFVLKENLGATHIHDEGLLSSAELASKNAKAILLCIPQVIPFTQRVSLFQTVLAHDRRRFQSDIYEGTRVAVRRGQLLIDSFAQLNHNNGKTLRGRIQVNFVSDQGILEPGIDGGGLFKEFIDSFCKLAFSPTTGVFMTTSNHTVIPRIVNVEGANVTPLEIIKFIGKMVGKAMYERILVESQFAGCFLNVLVGRTNEVDDLVFLDKDIYRSLLQLKKIAAAGESIEALGLFFEVTRSPGVMVELIPGGSSVPVTNENYRQYIHRYAHKRLNEETMEQSRAFLSGLRELIPLDMLQLFSAQEVQLLIGGDPQPIDIMDLQSTTVYGGGYHPSQPYIQAFWEIVASMTPLQQRDLLKFATSCSRQPLLGFAQLDPRFGIQRVPLYASGSDTPSVEEQETIPRLPSASTCINLLKLPKYATIEELRTKLLYAIASNSGFELS